MSEIVVGDLLAWEPGLGWSGDEGDTQRPLSWAVTIHATVPALPPLRGGELIVVPPRRLEQLQAVEMIGWREIARLMAAQPVAGIVVERGFEATPTPGVPLLRADSEFLPDAELYLNRTITEHRAELYRLGSDLSRALSTASIGGADLNALVTVAGDVGRHELLLFDESGAVLGRSRTAPSRVPSTIRLVRASPEGMVPVLTPSGRWLVQWLSIAGDRLCLAAGPGPAGTPETARLVLTQTATVIEAFLGPLGNRRRAEAPPSRESLLADLLLGRIAADQIGARAEILGIEPDEPLRVALFSGENPGFDGSIRTALGRDIRDRLALLSPRELAVLVSEGGWLDWWKDLQAAARQDSGVTLVRSEQQPGIARIVRATRQARALGRLRSTRDAVSSNVFELLLPVWDPGMFEPGPERLRSFAHDLLGLLEEQDRERGSDLVPTLQGYLAAGGSATGAAERLQVHRNTLGYRLKRISELTGTDLDDADIRLAYGLAFKVRQLEHLLE